MRRITGTDDIAFGHFGTTGICFPAGLAACVVRLPLHGRDEPAENLPQFLRDSSISISLTMMIIYLIMAVSAGRVVCRSDV